MKFFKTTMLASVSTATTMLTGLITTKIVAVLIGPDGMALTGQFYNITAIVTLLATAACTTGLIKHLAEKNEQEKREQIVNTVYLITGGAIIALSLFLLLFSGFLTEKVFVHYNYRLVFLIYGSLLFFSIQNVLFTSILNGIGKIKQMTFLTISGSLLNMISVIVFARFYGVEGVLISSSISNVVLWFVGLNLVRKFQLAPRFRNGGFDKETARSLMGFSVMSLVTGLLLPSIQFMIRTKLIQQFSVHDAGIWQATMRLSDYYLNFVYSVLSVYYLPKLASIQDPGALRKEILLGYARIVPAIILITSIIWFSRYLIINIILTKDFYGILSILHYYLIGDILKIISWILAFLMWAKGLKKLYIITEFTFFALYILLNILLINRFGIEGAGMAYVVLYSFYTLMIFVVLRKFLTGQRAAA